MGGEKEEGKEETITDGEQTKRGGEERGGPGYILLMQ